LDDAEAFPRQPPAGKQRGDHIHGRHWARLAEEIGMSAPQVRRRVRELANKVLAQLNRLTSETSQLTFTMEVARAIEARCRRILVNLDDG